MGIPPQLITNFFHKQAVKDLKGLIQNNRAAIRLRAIASAKTEGVNVVAKVFGVTTNTIRSWVKAYAKDGLSGLDYKPGRGRKGKLQDEHLQAIRGWVDKNCNMTIAEIVDRIKEKYGIETSKSAVHRVLQKLDLSYITPRPIHYKQDKRKSPEFKKNLKNKMEENPEKLFFFFDEARFGTHSNIGHGWFQKGSRTRVKVKLGFKYFYVYSAVNMSSGQDFSLIMPRVNTHAMNAYLKALSETLGDKQAVVVMDCAGWHTSKKLVLPQNIEIMLLPPYSPELNPVEKFWQYLKSKTIRNKIYKSLGGLEIAVSSILAKLKPQEIAITCSINHCLT